MADQSSKALRERLSAESTSLTEKYVGNGHFSIPPDVLRTFITHEANSYPKHERKDIYYAPHNLSLINQIRTQDEVVYLQLIDDAKTAGAWQIEKALEAIPTPMPDIAKPQSGTDLLAKQFAPPVYFVQNILCQGLTLLAGKSKRGKTYFCLDMAMAISFGRQAFRKLDTRKGRVLFVSLEDGEILIQENLKKIQPNLNSLPDMDFLYDFPRLGEGAMELLEQYLKSYDLIVLDILGRILPDMSRMRKNMNEYQIITDYLGPIHDLVRDTEKAIIITDHLRKAPSDDEFDEVSGSMAKVGVVDHVMLFKRQADENEAQIKMIGKRINHHKLVVTMVDGHLEYVGEGENYEMEAENRKIITVLQEEGRPIHTREIVQALGLPDKQFHRIRMRLTRLYNEGTIGRHKGSGKWTLGNYNNEAYDDPVPF